MATRKRRRVSGTSVGRTRRRRTTHHTTTRRRRVSGVGSTVGRTRRRRSGVGKTNLASIGKQIIPMAVGMGIGVGVQHFILRPLEAQIAQRAPQSARFMALGEIILGGLIALKTKNPIIRGVGLGIMAGGVQAGTKQLKLYRENPAVTGMGDYTTVQIPVGQIDNMINGVIRRYDGVVNTSLVAGVEPDLASDYREERNNMLRGLYGLDSAGELEEENYLPWKM